MKAIIRAATAAALVTMASAAKADSLGAYYGSMDTEMLGKGDIVGGVFEFDALPLISIQLRGGYADSFEELNDLDGMINGLNASYPQLAYLASYYGVDRYKLEMEDFCIIPLEVGLVGRFTLLGTIGAYAGGGAGYYVIPAFDIISSGGFSASQDIDNIVGYWGVVGIEAGPPSIAIFAEAKYTHIKEDDLEIEVDYMGYKGKLSADIDLSGVTYLVGLRFRW